MTSFHKRKLCFTRQSEASECGLACISMLADYFGMPTSIQKIRNLFPSMSAGATVNNLLLILSDLNLAGRAVRLELSELKKLQLPAIIHWDMNHFVVLEKVDSRKCVILDPAAGRREYRIKDVDNRFTGIAIEVSARQVFSGSRTNDRTSFSDLFEIDRKFVLFLMKILSVFLLWNISSLFMPVYILLTFDMGLSNQDLDWLLILAIIFLTVQISRAVFGYIKDLYIVDLKCRLGFDISNNLFSHLISLPLDYFQKRRVPDIVAAIDAVENVKRIIASHALGAASEAIFCSIAFAVLLLISWKLALITLCFAILVSAITVIRSKFNQIDHVEKNRSRSAHKRLLAETFANVESWKFDCKEASIFQHWQKSYSEFLNTEGQGDQQKSKQDFYYSLLTGTEFVVTMYVGALLVNGLELTTGQFFAYILLKQQFFTSTNCLSQSVTHCSELPNVLDSLHDIASQESEFQTGVINPFGRRPSGVLEANCLSYRFLEKSDYVFKNVSFEAMPGELVCISGKSGSGKTTLLKLLAGTIKPESGTIHVGNELLDDFGKREFRQYLAMSTHSSRLISGTVSENIANSSETVDSTGIVHAAMLVELHEVIMRLPMNYATPIGELYTTLSGGEIQRILLARAVYKDPIYMFLDESFSNIEVSMAVRILTRIKIKGVTVLLISHSEELTEKVADRSVKIFATDRAESLPIAG